MRNRASNIEPPSSNRWSRFRQLASRSSRSAVTGSLPSIALLVAVAFAITSARAADTLLVSRSDAWRYHKGTNAPQANWRTIPDASLDGTWAIGNGGFGYADNAPESGNCQTLLPDMRNGYSTLYLRRTFEIANAIDPNDRMKLTMDWDDGYVAYLDGVELQRAFSPGAVGTEPAFNALASGGHECSTGNSSPQPVATYDLGLVGSRLSPGAHVLAIMGLNVTNSSDFILIADLAHSSQSCPTNTICSDTTWTMAGGPYVVSNLLTVASDATLTIEPGVTVQFGNGAGLIVRGRLRAEGSPANRITFTRAPGATSWTRLDFTANAFESRITFADIAYAAGAGNIRGNGTSLYLEGIVWTNTTTQLLDLNSCSITLLDSVLPNISGVEMVHGSGLPANGRALFQGNVFGSSTGSNDIIDFTGGQRPGAILQVYDNVFLGATADALDLDGTDAHIEGNVFMHIHADAGPAAPDTASGVSGGRDGSRTSRMTITRNLFYDCDRGILCKDQNFYVIQNNTFVKMDVAAVNFDEPLRSGVTAGAGVIFEDNIVWNSPTNFENVYVNDPTNGTTALSVSRNIFSAPDHTNGFGNRVIDPLLVGTNGVTAENIRALFALQTNSPAIGAGPNGVDLGGVVPRGAAISGEPPAATTNDWAVLTVAGPGVAAYRWRLNNGSWSGVVPLTNGYHYTTNLFANATPIIFSNLAPGNYTVFALGINSAGVSQNTNAPTVSKTWTVQGSYLGVGGTLASNTTWSAAQPIHVTNHVTVPANVTLTIQAGALVRLGSGFSINAPAGGAIIVAGTAANPVRFRPLNGTANWGRLGATGNASLVMRHADVQNGQAAVLNGAHGTIEFCYFHDYYDQPVVLSDQAASIVVRASRFRNYYETLFRHGVIVVEDSLFEDVTGDAVDFDFAEPGSVIRRCTLRRGLLTNVDAVDLGSDSHGVLVENCLMYNFPFDKGVSIGEISSNIVVRGCVMFGVDMGVAVKDSSEAVIVNNTIAASANGLRLYEKTAGQGGGHAAAWNNILWNNTNSIVLLNGSTIAASYSDISGAGIYPGTGNLNANPLFLNATLHDYRLAAGSPAIGTGTNGTTMGALFPVGSYLVDTDGDGLPDTWEQTYDLDFNDPADAASDVDNDGLTSLQEFWAGTIPTDSASNVRIAAATLPGQGVVLSFEAISNRTYNVENRASLGAGNWTNLLSFTPALTNRIIQATNIADNGDARFYRLVVHP